jgi:hypothetical protein
VSIGALIEAISSAITDGLDQQGIPQLANMRVELGKRFLDDALPTPRIVFVPKGIRHEAAESATPTVAEYRAGLIQKAFLTRWTTYEVHVFGAASSPDGATEYDLTEFLLDTVLWQLDQIARGSVLTGGGEWDPEGESQFTPQTHHAVVAVEIATPVLDKPAMPARAFVNPGTTLDGTDVKYAGSTEAP